MKPGEILLIIMILVVLGETVFLFLQKKKKTSRKPEQDQKGNFDNAYKSKWLFTLHEKDAYRAIRAVADELGLTVFAKVRLFDLIEPKADTENKRGAQYKIQAKHCDFVLCNEKLVAKIVIELDDSSHQRQDRKDRDQFVDTVLRNTGYTVLHYTEINPEQLKKDLEQTLGKGKA